MGAPDNHLPTLHTPRYHNHHLRSPHLVSLCTFSFSTLVYQLPPPLVPQVPTVVDKAIKSEGGGQGAVRRAAAFARAFCAHIQKLRQVRWLLVGFARWLSITLVSQLLLFYICLPPSRQQPTAPV